MAGGKGSASTAQKVDKAWKVLLKYRKDKNIPQVKGPGDVNESWLAGYEMTRQDLNAVREAVRTIVQGLGSVPWHHEPEEKANAGKKR